MRQFVWDYPRPPRLELSPKRIEVIFNGIAIATSQRTYRVLETSHPPVYYIPPEDIKMEYLTPAAGQSFCEWKGIARYYTIIGDEKQAKNAAWYYPDPTPTFAAIKDYVAFYPSRMDACYVDGEQVTPQKSDFYGGWVTSDIVGPFKESGGIWG